MKKTMTLLSYVLLIYAIYVIPINTAAFSINFSNVFGNESPQQAKSLNTFSLTELSDERYFVTFALDSTKPLSEDTLKKDLIISTSVTTYDKKVLTLQDVDYEINKENLRYVIGIKPIKLGGFKDFHTNTFNFDIQFRTKNLALTHRAFTAYENFKANGKSEHDVTTALIPVYYADEKNVFSLPIYTEIKAGKNHFRRILNSIATPTEMNGLSKSINLPNSIYVWYSAGILELKYTTNKLDAFSSPQKAQMALDNLLKTFEYSKRDKIVNKVRIIIDGGQTSKAFGGIDISEPFDVNRNPKVYLPLVSRENILWVPFDLSDNEDVAVVANAIIDAFKNPNRYSDDERLISLIKEDLSLDSIQVVGETIKLTFDKDLKSIFDKNADYAACFIEGLTLSMTSIPFIENVELYIDGEKISSLGGYHFEIPLVKPTYFNVDKAYIKE